MGWCRCSVSRLSSFLPSMVAWIPTGHGSGTELLGSAIFGFVQNDIRTNVAVSSAGVSRVIGFCTTDGGRSAGSPRAIPRFPGGIVDFGEDGEIRDGRRHESSDRVSCATHQVCVCPCPRTAGRQADRGGSVCFQGTILYVQCPPKRAERPQCRTVHLFPAGVRRSPPTPPQFHHTRNNSCESQPNPLSHPLALLRTYILILLAQVVLRAVPYRKDFYESIAQGGSIEKLNEELAKWLAGLDVIVKRMCKFLDEGNYGKV